MRWKKSPSTKQKEDKMTKKINDIQKMFAYHGFINSPISRKKITSLIIRGFSKESIYLIGCDIHNGTSYLK